MTSFDHAHAALTHFDIGAASLIGGRTLQQDAHDHRYRHHGDYVVAAVADGLGRSSRSGLIAEASVAAVTAFGTALDYQDDPAHLIELARVTLPLHAVYASGAQHHTLLDFEELSQDARRPDTYLVVATVARDGEVHVGWVGDCRAWIHLGDGRLIQLTSDHNRAAHGQPHAVTRCLGSTPGPETSRWHRSSNQDWRPTHVVLTTDGVHGPLTPSAIARTITTAPTAQRAARWLTRAAVRAAGTNADNATAMVVRLPDCDRPR